MQFPIIMLLYYIHSIHTFKFVRDTPVSYIQSRVVWTMHTSYTDIGQKNLWILLIVLTYTHKNSWEFYKSLFEPNWWHMPGGKISNILYSLENNSFAASFTHLKLREIKEDYIEIGASKAGIWIIVVNNNICSFEGCYFKGVLNIEV